MGALQRLSNGLLVESYEQAIKQGLELDFIELIKQEIKRRGLTTQ